MTTFFIRSPRGTRREIVIDPNNPNVITETITDPTDPDVMVVTRHKPNLNDLQNYIDEEDLDNIKEWIDNAKEFCRVATIANISLSSYLDDLETLEQHIEQINPNGVEQWIEAAQASSNAVDILTEGSASLTTKPSI